MVALAEPKSEPFSQERVRLRSRSRPCSLQNAYPRSSQARLGHRFYNPSLGRWLNRDPAAERGGLNLYRSFNNDAVNKVDALGLWELVSEGTWLVSQWNQVESDFTTLKTLIVPDLLTKLDAGIAKAEALPKGCEYRKYLIDKLKDIRGTLQGVKDKLDSSTKIYLRAENWTDPDQPQAETWWWGGRIVRFNYNSPYSYFTQGEQDRRATLFHELTHVEGASDSGFWNNAHVLDSMIRTSWDYFAGNVGNIVRNEKGEKCCPKERWPDN